MIAVLFLGLSVFTVVPFCRTKERTGYSGWWGLLSLLPFGPRDAAA
jgi:hypothetical protein